MKAYKIAIAIVAGVILLVVLDFGFGFLGVFKTKTVEKARQNAQREVFEQSQSYVEGKRQSAIKYYKEYSEADESKKKSLEYIISQEFANFNEDQYLSGELRAFIHDCKY